MSGGAWFEAQLVIGDDAIFSAVELVLDLVKNDSFNELGYRRDDTYSSDLVDVCVFLIIFAERDDPGSE